MKLRHRIIDALDEWFHEHGFGWVRAEGKPATVVPWWGRLVKPLCDTRERRDMRPEWFSQYPSSTSNSTFTRVPVWSSHRKGPR